MASRYDKRGASEGGASAGRTGRKTGGSAYSASEPENHGALTCPDCQGTGYPERRQLEADEDGTFAGSDSQKCSTCDGTGTVSA